jgi:hypothetical protein
VILGGGIKQTVTSAFASLFGDFQVTLRERERIGGRTTARNHVRGR